MIEAILFDKKNNRKEIQLPMPEEEIEVTEVRDGITYKISYVFQFNDKKKRAIYTEKSKTKVKE